METKFFSEFTLYITTLALTFDLERGPLLLDKIHPCLDKNISYIFKSYHLETTFRPLQGHEHQIINKHSLFHQQVVKT